MSFRPVIARTGQRTARTRPRSRAERTCRSRWAVRVRWPAALHLLAGQVARLFDPGGELVLVEVVSFVDVEVAHLVVLGLLGRNGIKRAPAEELKLYVLGVAAE